MKQRLHNARDHTHRHMVQSLAHATMLRTRRSPSSPHGAAVGMSSNNAYAKLMYVYQAHAYRDGAAVPSNSTASTRSYT